MLDSWWAVDATKTSTLQEIWQKCCPEIYKMWTVEHKNALTKACLGLLLKQYSFYDMSKMLLQAGVPGVRSDWRNLRWALINDCRTNLGVKLLLLRCVAKQAQNIPVKLEREIVNNGLYGNDKALFFYLEDMQMHEAVLNTLHNLPGGTVPSIKIVQKDCQQCIANTLQWINRFVGKKHRFIYESNGYQHSDIVNDLQVEIIRKFYMLTPFLSVAHRENTVKRAAHNYGINLIKYYTHPDRARQRKVNGQFVNIIQGFGNACENYEQLNEDDNSYGNGHEYFRTQATYDNLTELRNYINFNEQDLPIITLLTLKDDNYFIKWSENNYTNYFDSTEEVYEYLGQEAYYEAIANYLHLPIENVLNTVFSLRNRLSYV